MSVSNGTPALQYVLQVSFIIYPRSSGPSPLSKTCLLRVYLLHSVGCQLRGSSGDVLLLGAGDKPIHLHLLLIMVAIMVLLPEPD